MSRFAEHVTSTAFHLSLSRRMIEALWYIDKRGHACCSGTTFSALETRGLIQFVTKKRTDKYDHDKGHWVFAGAQLTEAGRALLPLLKLAGLHVQYPELVEPEQSTEPLVKLKDISGEKTDG